MLEEDVELLMKIQYDFPVTNAPFREIGEAIGLSEDEVIEKINFYLMEGVITKIGLQLNHRCLEENKTALVGLKVGNREIRKVAQVINGLKEVKHNYLRDDEQFNVWFTLRSKRLISIFRRVKEIVEEVGVNEYVVLPTKRVYKLDVKYDLNRGISWSDPRVEPSEVPLLKNLNLNLDLIFDLKEKFKLSRKPFKWFSKKYGVSEEKILSIITRLIKLHVAKGFGATLSPEKIGFNENAMIVLEIKPDKVQRICTMLVEKFPQITHCVEREVDPNKWNYQAYLMVHSKTRDSVFEIVDEISNLPEVLEVRTLFSLVNLKGEKLDQFNSNGFR